MDFLRNLFGKKKSTAPPNNITRKQQPSREQPPILEQQPVHEQRSASEQKVSFKHTCTLKEDWDRNGLVDKGYASADTMRKMMVYRVLLPEDTTFDPSRNKLSLRDSKLFCGVCLTNSKIKPVPGSTTKPFALNDLTLCLKGPLDFESKHLTKCPQCGSQIQICGDQLKSPPDSEYLITLFHTIAPPSYLRHRTFELPRIMVDEVEVVYLNE